MLLQVLSVCELFIRVVFADAAEDSKKLCNRSTPNYTNCDVRIRKCCPDGFYHYHEEDFDAKILYSNCTEHNATSFSVPIYDGTTKKYDLTDFFVEMLNCENKVWLYFKINNSDPRDKYYIQSNGSLYCPKWRIKYFNPDRYCVDEEDGLSVYLCYTEIYMPIYLKKGVTMITIIGMIISMPFLLATFVVYAILPDSNLHSKGLMSFVMTLLIANIFLVTVQLIGIFSDPVCVLIGYTVIFLFMASFLWMNVMCIDMWLAFSGRRGFGKSNSEKNRFMFYCLYAWGVPVLHVLFVYLINTYGNREKIYYPGVGTGICFLEDGYPSLFYFYGPIGVVITINIALFILTAIEIRKVKKETSMLKHSDCNRHTYEDHTQKFNLYVKLLFAMGINWTMGIISWAFTWKMGESVPPYIWYLTDFCNALYGAFIFFIFVFKRKVWKTLQKRYYVFIGKPNLGQDEVK